MKNTQETIDRYCKDWGLSNPSLVDVDSACSDVFIVNMKGGEKAALKIRHGRGIDAERYGADALNFFEGQGVVKLYRHDNRAHLLEYIDGKMLRYLVDSGQDAEATGIICDVIEKLHALPIEVMPHLNPLENHCSELFRQASLSGANDVLKRAAKIGRELLDSQTNIRPLHGDVHHENILMSNRGWLLIDPNGLIGDPVYEFANTFNNPYGVHEIVGDPNRINMLADIIADKTGYDRTKVMKYGAMHIALSASWALETGYGDSAKASLKNCATVLKLIP